MTKNPPKLNITPEIQAEIERILATPADELEGAKFRAALRKGADEHKEILRKSREMSLRYPRVYR